MGRSQTLIAAATRFPRLSRPVVHGACAVSAAIGQDRPHWLLLHLKDVLEVRLARKIHIDGFVIESDPLDGPGRLYQSEGLTEPETRALFDEFLKPQMVVLDIGAYIGQFSLVASRAMRGTGRILCFEPTPTVFEQLKRNLERNNCQNVEPVCSAVSDSEGEATFYVRIGSNDQSSLYPLATNDQVNHRVKVTTVDAIVKQAGIKALHLIKIDTEGNDLSVLKGATETLARFRPNLVIEISRHQRAVGYSGAEIKGFLDRLDYDCFRLSSDGRSPYRPTPDEINEEIRYFNILAAPRSAS